MDMDKERYNDFLEFALKRILESAESYAAEAKMCKEQPKKLLLFFLAARKREQYVRLEKDNAALRTSPRDCERNLFTFKEIQYGNIALNLMVYSEIKAVLKKRAEREFKFFIDLASFEEDIATKKLLINLSKMSKKAINDIETGFALFINPPKKVFRLPVLCREILPIAIRGEGYAVFN